MPAIGGGGRIGSQDRIQSTGFETHVRNEGPNVGHVVLLQHGYGVTAQGHVEKSAAGFGQGLGQPAGHGYPAGRFAVEPGAQTTEQITNGDGFGAHDIHGFATTFTVSQTAEPFRQARIARIRSVTWTG